MLIVIYLYVKLPPFHMILEKMVLDGGLEFGESGFPRILGIPSGGAGGDGCVVVLGAIPVVTGGILGFCHAYEKSLDLAAQIALGGGPTAAYTIFGGGIGFALGGVATAVGFGFGYAAGSLAKTFS